MKKNNFKSVYSTANILYRTTMDPNDFEDIALNGWQLIGNRQTKLHKLTTNTVNGKVSIPCNCEYIEAIFSNVNDAKISSNMIGNYDNRMQWVEDYIESWRKNKNAFYESGALVTYRVEGNELVFDRDYDELTILYHGIIADEDGLPYLSDKEVQALAAYCAYVDMYRQSLAQKNGNLLQLAATLEAKWIRLCNSARTPVHISQNEMDDILDVKTRWDRKQYGKSFKPII